MNDLIVANVTIIVPAGNHALSPSGRKIDRTPALWGWTMPLIVVGAVRSNNGRVADFSQGIELDSQLPVLWAPGHALQCASNTSIEQTAYGTSFAAGMVHFLRFRLPI